MQEPNITTPEYRIEVLDDLGALPSADWDALLAAQAMPTPFIRHAYLHALQASGSATDATG